MKTDAITMKEIEKLLESYHKEISLVELNKVLKNNTAQTYKLHSENFVRWIKGEFEPGRRNK